MFRILRLALFILIAWLIFQNRSTIFAFLNEQGFIKKQTTIEKLSIRDNAINNINSQVEPRKEVDLPGPLKNILDSRDFNQNLSYKNIIIETNIQRKKFGLQPLKENLTLNDSARYKSKDMDNRQYFEHESPDGKNVDDLSKIFGYKYIIIGENLAMGNFESEEKIVDAWMNSPGHRANILNPKYSEIGVGLIYGKWNGQDVLYSVQHFGKPLSECPSVDENLKKSIDKNQITISDLIKNMDERKLKIDSFKSPNKEYYEMVAGYNDLVNEYNQLINKTKLEIDRYNEQIRNFNKCSQ